MKKWIIGVAALLAVTAPGVAAAQTGFAGVTYSHADVDNVGNTDVYGIEGAVFFEGSGDIGFEIDAAVLDSDNADAAGSIAAHVFKRTDRYLFGGFAAVSGNDDSSAWEVGVEANKYLDRVTVGASLAYGDGDADVDYYGVTVDGSYFVTDNLRVGAGVGWANVNTAFGDGDGWVFGVNGEYQLEAYPVSFAVGYSRIDSDDAGLEADVGTIAVRYNFGGGTLFDRDRTGASQANRAGLSSLTRFGY